MDTSSLEQHISLAVVTPYLLQWLKGQKWFPFLSYTSGTMNRWITALVAAAAGFGIGVSFNSDAGVLTVTGLTLAGLWAGTQHAIVQWAMQHGAYKTLIAPALPGAVQATERAQPTAKIIEPMVGDTSKEGPAKKP